MDTTKTTRPTARLYNCARCHCQVLICRYCDRGNIYCARECAIQARQEAQRRATRQYQNTRRGRLANAQRQRRFRERQRQKVTHQGSPPKLAFDSLVHERTRTQRAEEDESRSSKAAITCHFCRCECSPFLRLDFLTASMRWGRCQSP